MLTALTLNQPTPRIRYGRTRTALDISRLVHPADWASLPRTLRARFQPGHRPARYIGCMSFERSAIGGAFAWLARVAGAPLPLLRAAQAPVTVDVCSSGDGVAWSRELGPGYVVRSVKSPGPAGTLLERTDGGLGMVLDVSVEDCALVFTSRRFFFAAGRWRVPIPSLLTPGRCRVEHRAIEDERFRFTLTMRHPIWGVTFRQTGVFTDHQESLS